MHHVVYTQSLCTDGAGQEDSVEEAQDPAGETGTGEKNGAGEKGAFFGGQFGNGNHGSSDSGNYYNYIGSLENVERIFRFPVHGIRFPRAMSQVPCLHEYLMDAVKCVPVPAADAIRSGVLPFSKAVVN